MKYLAIVAALVATPAAADLDKEFEDFVRALNESTEAIQSESMIELRDAIVRNTEAINQLHLNQRVLRQDVNDLQRKTPKAVVSNVWGGLTTAGSWASERLVTAPERWENRIEDWMK